VPKEQLGKILASIDIFLALVDHGASGRHSKLAHAFGCGLCVVSSTGPEADYDLFRHNDNCMLVPNNDFEQIFSTIDILCRDPALRARLGRAAYETYLASLSWSVITQSFLELLAT
jgi:glycosyltransferase involved in cell wall biosynthesis